MKLRVLDRMNPIFRHPDLPLQYLGNLDALCSNFNTTGEEASQILSNTVLLVTMTKSKPDSFISYCTECFVKVIEYILALLPWECSHTEVSLTPHCSGNDLQEQCAVFSLVSFTPACKTWFGCCCHRWLICPLGNQNVLQLTEETVRCYSAMRKSRPTKVLSGWFGSSDVVMPQEGTAVYTSMNGIPLCLGHSAWFSHLWSGQGMTTPWPTFCNSSFTDILLCSSKIPVAWKEEAVKWSSVPCKPGTNSSWRIFSKIMEPLLNIDLIRRNAKYRLKKLSFKWSCLKWRFF